MKDVLLGGVGLLIAAILGLACSGRTGDRIILRDVPEAENIQPVHPAVRFPSCPSAGVPPMQAAQLGTGHHKVTLSWKASPVAPGPGNNVVGYCLYRSRKQDAPAQSPTCSVCEQINIVPVVGVSCIDDLVEDSTTYYYVVTAINAVGKISRASNQFTVAIPPGNQINSVPKGTQPPSCRAPAPQAVK